MNWTGLGIAFPRSKCKPVDQGTIYEVSPGDGGLLRRFELSDNRTAFDVASVHNRKFLSIDYGHGKVVPLVGTVR